MNKIVIFTTLLSAILLSACGGEPCVKLSELHSEETQEKWQQKFKDCGSFECRAKVNIEYKQLEEEYANKCDSQLANLDKVEVENKCKEMKIGKTKTCSEIKEAFDKKWKESRDEVLKELASNEDANWKATVCNKGEYSLSTFTVNTDDKPIGYIMLDFVVSDNILRSRYEREHLYLSFDSSFFLKSSGRDVKKEYKSEFIKNFSDPGASKFLKNDYGRIIVAMKKDAPLPDIHTLNGYVYSMSKEELVFAVDSTWNCTEMTAKEVFEKKNLVASACEQADKQACDVKVEPTPAPSQTQALPGSTPSTAPIPAAVQPIPTPSHDPTPTQAQPFPDIDAPAQIDTNAASDDPTVGGSSAQRYGIQYIREITYNGKSTPSWIILKDSKGRYCAIVTSSKYPVLEIEHYCIPFSGDDKDLKDSFAGNRVAEIDFPDHKKCKNVEMISDNDYCNRFNKAFEDMAKREQFFAVTEICRNDPDVDSDFWNHICQHLSLENDLD